jgi:hypothetical protein
MLRLLLLELLFVQLLAELLDFAPLVVADVRGHILYFDSGDPVRHLAKLLAAQFRRPSRALSQLAPCRLTLRTPPHSNFRSYSIQVRLQRGVTCDLAQRCCPVRRLRSPWVLHARVAGRDLGSQGQVAQPTLVEGMAGTSVVVDVTSKHIVRKLLSSSIPQFHICLHAVAAIHRFLSSVNVCGAGDDLRAANVGSSVLKTTQAVTLVLH